MSTIPAASALSRVSRRVRDSTTERDRLIQELREDGYSLRAIAQAAGLSHTAIAKILAR